MTRTKIRNEVSPTFSKLILKSSKPAPEERNETNRKPPPRTNKKARRLTVQNVSVLTVINAYRLIGIDR